MHVSIRNYIMGKLVCTVSHCMLYKYMYMYMYIINVHVCKHSTICMQLICIQPSYSSLIRLQDLVRGVYGERLRLRKHMVDLDTQERETLLRICRKVRILYINNIMTYMYMYVHVYMY